MRITSPILPLLLTLAAPAYAASVAGVETPFGIRPADTTGEAGRFHGAFFEKVSDKTLPSGWLLEFLTRQKSGLTGHLPELGHPFDSCLFAGDMPLFNPNEVHWWRYEQAAYYVDGMARLGRLLDDKAMLALAETNVAYVMAHQGADGHIGPVLDDKFNWPQCIFFRAMKSEYERTGDPRILGTLVRYYRGLKPEDFAPVRSIINVEGACWTYLKTGDAEVLKNAEAAWATFNAHKPGADTFNTPSMESGETVVMHGVTCMETLKLPVMLYVATGKPEYLASARMGFEMIERDHLLADGVPSSNEFLAGKNPSWSHETCDISDYTWTLEQMLLATGEAHYADLIERACFNAGPGAVSKDFRNFQYFSSVNQAIAVQNSNHNVYFRGTNWMAYRPAHGVGCCTGNVHRFMPDYVLHQWRHTVDGGVAAALYGPGTFSATVAGTSVSIEQKTAYPFGDDITFVITAAQPAKFPLHLRIPGWCDGAGVAVNGADAGIACKPASFAILDREWKSGDTVTLRLPMRAKLTDVSWFSEDGRNPAKWLRIPIGSRKDKRMTGIHVDYGPLLFALPVKETVTVSDMIKIDGIKRATKEFPALDIRPAGPWNYALAVTPKNFAERVSVVKTGATGYPLDPGKSPLEIRVPARLVNNWSLKDNRFMEEIPETPRLGEKDTVSLVPYGSTRLRIGVFPQAKED